MTTNIGTISLEERDQTIINFAIIRLIERANGGGREVLTANRNYYVDDTSPGSDSNDGLTSSTPWATLQHAIDEVGKVDLGGFTATINVAAGSYAGFFATTPFVGGDVTIKGDDTTPANVNITSVVSIRRNATLALRGLKFSGGLQAIDGGSIRLDVNNEFGPTSTQILIQSGGRVNTNSSPYRVTGNCVFHAVIDRGEFVTNASVVTISGSPTITAWAQVNGQGMYWPQGATFVGAPAAGTQKFNLASFGLIRTGGQSLSFLPGTVAGSNSGGLYT